MLALELKKRQVCKIIAKTLDYAWLNEVLCQSLSKLLFQQNALLHVQKNVLIDVQE